MVNVFLTLAVFGPISSRIFLEELSTEEFLRNLKEKFGFSHIEPNNKDIFYHIQCSTALLWHPAQS